MNIKLKFESRKRKKHKSKTKDDEQLNGEPKASDLAPSPPTIQKHPPNSRSSTIKALMLTLTTITLATPAKASKYHKGSNNLQNPSIHPLSTRPTRKSPKPALNASAANNNIIFKRMPEIYMKAADQLSINLNDYLRLEGLVNVGLESSKEGVEIMQPFSLLINEFTVLDNCKVQDTSNHKAGTLFLCQGNQVAFLQDMSRVTMLSLTLNATEIPDGLHGEMNCGQARYTSEGVYVFCLVQFTGNQTYTTLKVFYADFMNFAFLNNVGFSKVLNLSSQSMQLDPTLPIQVAFNQNLGNVDQFSFIISQIYNATWMPNQNTMIMVFTPEQASTHKNSKNTPQKDKFSKFSDYSIFDYSEDSRASSNPSDPSPNSTKYLNLTIASYNFSKPTPASTPNSCSQIYSISRTPIINSSLDTSSDFIVFYQNSTTTNTSAAFLTISPQTGLSALITSYQPPEVTFSPLYSIDDDYIYTVFSSPILNKTKNTGKNGLYLGISSNFKLFYSNITQETLTFNLTRIIEQQQDELDREGKGSAGRVGEGIQGNVTSMEVRSNSYATLIRFWYNGSKNGYFLFDKQERNALVNFVPGSDDFYDFFAYKSRFYVLHQNNRFSTYSLSMPEILLNGSKILHYKNNPVEIDIHISSYAKVAPLTEKTEEKIFSQKISKIEKFDKSGAKQSTEESQKVTSEIDVFSFVIIILENTAPFISVDIPKYNITWYNGLTFSLPIDKSAIRGSNLVYTSLNSPSENIQIESKIIHPFRMDFEQYQINRTSQIIIIDDLLIQLQYVHGSYDLKGRVLHIENVGDFSADLKPSTAPPFYINCSTHQKIMEYKKVVAHYTYLLVKCGNHYNLYFLIWPNYVTTKFDLPYEELALVVIPGVTAEANTMTLYVSNYKNCIDVYTLNADKSTELTYVTSLNSTSLEIQNFCPMDLSLNPQDESTLYIMSSCSADSNIFLYDMNAGYVYQQEFIDNMKDPSLFMCPFQDGYLIRKQQTKIYGFVHSLFPFNHLYYNLEDIDLSGPYDINCFSEISSVVIFLQRKEGIQNKSSLVILKGDNSLAADRRLYTIKNFDSDVTQVLYYPFGNSILLLEIEESSDNYNVSKILLDGPTFESKTTVQPEETPFDLPVKLKIQSGKALETIDMPVRVEQPQYIPKLKKKSEIHFDGSFPLDNFIDITGPLYGLEIWRNSISNKSQNLSKIDQKSDSNGSREVSSLPDTLSDKPRLVDFIYMKRYELITNFSLTGKVVVYFNFTTRDESGQYILGYNIGEGQLYAFDSSLHYIKNFKLDVNCTFGDHSLMQDGILLALGCKSRKSFKLRTFYLNMQTFNFTEVNSYADFGKFNRLSLFVLEMNTRYMLKLDFEDQQETLLVNYHTQFNEVNDDYYEYMKDFLSIQKCLSLSLVHIDNLIILVYNNEYYYDTLKYIILRQADGTRHEGTVEVKQPLYGSKLFCFHLSQETLRCLLFSKSITFYELVLKLSPQQSSLIHYYISPYSRYLDYTAEDAQMSESYILIQSYSADINERALLVYQRSSGPVNMTNPTQLYFSFNQSEYCSGCDSATEIYFVDNATFIFRAKYKKIALQKIKMMPERQLFSNTSISADDFKYYNVLLTQPMASTTPAENFLSLQELMKPGSNSEVKTLNINLVLLTLMLMVSAGSVLMTFYLEDKKSAEMYRRWEEELKIALMPRDGLDRTREDVYHSILNRRKESLMRRKRTFDDEDDEDGIRATGDGTSATRRLLHRTDYRVSDVHKTIDGLEGITLGVEDDDDDDDIVE